MGGTAHLVAVGAGPAAIEAGRRRLADLEARWSRFRPDSEISRLNGAAGRPCIVSADTILLVERSVDGWLATAGAFDPTVLPALESAGYDRDFQSLAADPRPAGPPAPAPGCLGIRVDQATRMVFVPAGTALDPGGIGKGLAADLAVEEMLAAGATGACVNVGGDLRVAGEPPGPDGWVIGVEDPGDPGRELDRLRLQAGGVATSGTGYRRWSRAGRDMHHLIDPGLGIPALRPNALAMALAGTGWWAEVMTKVALLAGTGGPAALAGHGSTGMVVTADGEVLTTPGYGAFRCSPAGAAR